MRSGVPAQSWRARGSGDRQGEWASRECAGEETRLAIEHLEAGCMSRFTRFVFDPANPCIAGASVLGSVVAAQTAYLQSTYNPLPPPARDCSCGHIRYTGEGAACGRRSSELRRIIVLGDSLVLSIGCEENPVFAESIARGVSDHTKTNVVWRSFGVDGGDVRTIHQRCLENVRAVVESRPPPNPEHETTYWAERSVGFRARGAARDHAHASVRPPSEDSMRRRHEAEYIWRFGEDARASGELENAALGQSSCAAQGGARGGVGRVSVDVCMILCGLNDFKKLWKGHTTSAFGCRLRKLLMDLRFVLGPQCVIVLPGLPMEPTRFPEPLRAFVLFLAEVYDEEKARLATLENRRGAGGGSVLFIPKPSVRWWKRVHEEHGSVMSDDGVHPNEVGYRIYGHWLGQAVSKHLILADLELGNHGEALGRVVPGGGDVASSERSYGQRASSSTQVFASAKSPCSPDIGL